MWEWEFMGKVIVLIKNFLNEGVFCFEKPGYLLESLSCISGIYWNDTNNVGFGGMSKNSTSASDMTVHLWETQQMYNPNTNIFL